MRKILILIIMFIGCQPFEYECSNEEYDVECDCYGYIENTEQVLNDSYFVCTDSDSSWFVLSN